MERALAQLAVVRAEFTGINPELLVFLGLPDFETHLVGFADRTAEWTSFSNLTQVSLKFQGPGRILTRLTRRPYSPASLVNLDTLQPTRHAAIIETAEAYSSITRQCIESARRHRQRVVVSVWETLSGASLWNLPPYSFNVRKVKGFASLFFARTKRALSYLAAIGAPREKSRLVYPGIDVDRFHPPASTRGRPFRILYVGRFDREKGLATLLESFSLLHRENKNTELWIRAKTGTGIIEGLAREYSRHLPITFISSCEYEEMPQLYQDCDVLCLPSMDRVWMGIKIWEEQFGFVLIEAMATGLPLIGTKCGAIPEVIGPHNAVVPQDSPLRLMKELKRLCEDPELRQRLSQLNRNRALELFNLEKQRLITNQILSELL